MVNEWMIKLIYEKLSLTVQFELLIFDDYLIFITVAIVVIVALNS